MNSKILTIAITIKNSIRYILGFLLAFVALNAFAGGSYAISGAKEIPVEWLKGSIFTSYFIPGIILFFVVGGAFLYATIAVLSRSKNAKRVVIVSVAIVFVWLTVQLLIIGYVSWMQPVTAAITTLILLLVFLLRTDIKYFNLPVNSTSGRQ